MRASLLQVCFWPAFTPHNCSHTNMHNFNVMGFCCYVPGTADEAASLSMSIQSPALRSSMGLTRITDHMPSWLVLSSST